MKYSVGEVAKLLGITPNALRFYDKQGMIKTQKEENGRRFYTQVDMTRLLSFKKYSSMGVPLKTIGKQFTAGGDRRQIVQERIMQCQQEAREKAAFYQNLADSISDHIDLMTRMEAHHGELRIETSPECLILFDQENQLMTLNQTIRKQMKAWISAMPATKLACVYLGDNLFSGQSTLAYSILSDMAQKAGLDRHGPHVIAVPAKPSLHVMLSHYDAFTNPEAAFSTVFQYMQEKNLKLDGIPWAQVIVVESDLNDTYHVFLDVWVPFKL